MKKLVEYIDNLIAKLLGVLSKYLGSDREIGNDKLIYGAKVEPIRTDIPPEDIKAFKQMLEEAKCDEDFQCNVDDLDDFVAERTEQNPQFTHGKNPFFYPRLRGRLKCKVNYR